MKRFNLTSLVLLFCSLTLSLNAQQTFPRNGVYDERDGHYAFTNATLFKTYNEKIENATLVIKDGKVVASGKNISIPSDAVVVDVKGKYIYPSFIEIFAEYGMPKPEGRSGGGGFTGRQQKLSDKKGAYSWNEALRSEFAAHEHFKVDPKAAKAMRDLGFGAALSHNHDGISRGASTLVTFGEEKEHRVILKDRVAHHLSFNKGTSSQSYPGSLMGCIALLRQSYLDGEWYKRYGHEEETNVSLAAWDDLQQLPQIFEVSNKLEILRTAKLAKEFGVKYIVKGAGDEYQRINDIKAAGMPLIIPVNYPDAFDVTDPYDAMTVSLTAMKHWELAPSNANHLAKAGINFAFTTDGLKNKKDFMKNVRKAIERGLSESDALKALTHTPANLVGAQNIGNLRNGSLANFIITSKSVFDKDTKIHHNWVRGKANVIKELDAPELNGMYNLKVGDQSYSLEVSGTPSKMKIVVNDSTKMNVKHSYSNGLITLSFTPSKKDDGVISLSGVAEGTKWGGRGTLADGSWVSWSAGPTRALTPKEKKKAETKKPDEALGEITYPFLPFGWSSQPRAETVLFRNATVWTNESEGIIEGGDVLISNGKIVRVGKSLDAGNATVIDATGKHLSSGVIDEHTHIGATRGINECTQEVTAEVRIADVINTDDINIYRQLAGGVTAAQVLHGSCNPIGGQSGIIKFRWGASPEDMQIKGTPGFIKFALGENVKRSRWNNNDRFPNTRMGVEQTIQDAFQRAKDYQRKKASGDAKLRRDLELETLIEIMDEKRHISCHSYVQSEINMLMRLAEKMDFKVNTFTHILEGYKVADKMAKHGAGGSTFSDWWAYKYEVIDAIPHNADIMHDEGVVVAINSDDAEMARRLNQEAGKSVMYGGTSEEDAWKFVTLNPAKLLHLDSRMGSLKTGKDADVVLWSGHPMSVYTKAEMTFVDGIRYFDRAKDLELQKEVEKERARLIQKMLAAKKGGAKTRKPSGKSPELYHCDSDADEMRE